MKNTFVAFIVSLVCVYATKEYAYNIHNEINCISKNKISTEEACERWRRNMNSFTKDHLLCKEIWTKDGTEGRACSPQFIVNDDIVTKLSYRWKPSDTERPITVEVEYTGLSYKEQQFMLMVVGTCFIGIIAYFYVNGCPDCADSSYDNDNFLTGYVIGNMHTNSHCGWGSNNSYGAGFSVATRDD